MEKAIEEARISLREGGIPIGSVLTRNDEVIGNGHNMRVQDNDPMAHAEIECLRSAGRQPQYSDTVLYSTLMPCYLCAGAIRQFGIPLVVVGENLNFSGAKKWLQDSGIEVILKNDPICIEMLRDFIRRQPELWNEDIGK